MKVPNGENACHRALEIHGWIRRMFVQERLLTVEDIFNLFSSSQEELLLHILSTVNGNDIATN